MTEPSAEALALVTKFRRDILGAAQTDADAALEIDRFADSAYRRGYEKAREDAANVADNAWQHSPNPRQSEHAAIAYRILALAPPQEGS